MGTITTRRRRDGLLRYTAQIRMRRDGKLVHSESETFAKKADASAWLKKRETQLAVPGAFEKLKAPDPVLGEVIDRYIAESEKDIGRTKAQVLRAIKKFDIAGLPCSRITSADVVSFTRSLGVLPQTASSYVSHLQAVFTIARAAWSYPLDPQVMKDAVSVTRKLGMTSRSNQRDRRPTLAELDRIMTHFIDRKRRRPSSNPMPQIIAFALFSTRRLDEITRIAWADLDEAHSRVLVRDMKNPGETVGNHVWCDLPPEALRIIRSMPREAAAIFPFGSDAISAAFTRAMHFLAIKDLHFHDLRHEGVSRQFELGNNIPHVAAISGHRSWSSLKRYTHVRTGGDKMAGWPWLDVIAPIQKDAEP